MIHIITTLIQHTIDNVELYDNVGKKTDNVFRLLYLYIDGECELPEENIQNLYVVLDRFYEFGINPLFDHPLCKDKAICKMVEDVAGDIIHYFREC